MLYLVGLGLADEKDITVKGLEIVKKAERVYLEAYTSVLLVKKEQLVSVTLAIEQCRLLKADWLIVGSFLWTSCYRSRQRTSRNRQRRDPRWSR